MDHSVRVSSDTLASSQAFALEGLCYSPKPSSSLTDAMALVRSCFSMRTTRSEKTKRRRLPQRKPWRSRFLVSTAGVERGPQRSLAYLQSMPTAYFLSRDQPIWQSSNQLARRANHCLPSSSGSTRSSRCTEIGSQESLSANSREREQSYSCLTFLHCRYFPLRPSCVISWKEHLGRDFTSISAELAGMTTVRSDRVRRILMDSRYRSTGAAVLLLNSKAAVFTVQCCSPICSNALLNTSPFYTIWEGKVPKKTYPAYQTSPPRQEITLSPMYLLYLLKVRKIWLLVFMGPKLKAPYDGPSTSGSCCTPLRASQVSLLRKSLAKQQALQKALLFHSILASALCVPQNSTTPNTLSSLLRQSARSTCLFPAAAVWRESMRSGWLSRVKSMRQGQRLISTGTRWQAEVLLRVVWKGREKQRVLAWRDGARAVRSIRTVGIIMIIIWMRWQAVSETEDSSVGKQCFTEGGELVDGLLLVGDGQLVDLGHQIRQFSFGLKGCLLFVRYRLILLSTLAQILYSFFLLVAPHGVNTAFTSHGCIHFQLFTLHDVLQSQQLLLAKGDHLLVQLLGIVREMELLILEERGLLVHLIGQAGIIIRSLFFGRS